MKVGEQALISLMQIHKKLSLTKNLMIILYSISEEATKILSGDRATLYLYDSDKDELYSYVASKLEIDEIRLKNNQGIAGKVAFSKKSMIVNNVSESPFFNPFYDSRTSYKTETMIACPLINREGKLIGVIQVLNKKNGKFDQNDLGMLEILGSVAAIALEQAQLSNENQILKEYNRKLIQNFNAGVLVLDKDWEIQDFNNKFLEMFNLDKKIENQSIASVHPKIFRLLGNATQDNISFQVKDRYFNISQSELKDLDDLKVGLLLLITDITQKIQQDKAKELEERMSILGKMSSQIIHDIKNPLFVIKGYVKLLETAESHEDYNRYTGILNNEINRILEITQEILEFSKGDIEVYITEQTTAALNQKVLEIADKIKEIYNIEIGCTLDNSNDNRKVKLDMNKIERAIRNILTNAIEAFNDIGGPSILIETLVVKDNLFILVKDNGIGIPEDYRQTIFNPFFTYRKEKGTGLGLSIAQKILEKHEGSIQIINDAKWKTVFELRLPL